MAQKQIKVLLADDVRLELEIERTFFQRSGFTVLTAPDGLAALAMARSELPDLIVLDEVMPGLRGTEVCRSLRANEATRALPVIITSGLDLANAQDLSRAAGADAFVPKSEGREGLLRAAAKLLGIPERRTTRILAFFSVQEIVGCKETIGKAIDVSENGMCLEASRRYDSGSTFHLRFLLPGERQEHRATARLVRLQPRPDGSCLLFLEFTELTQVDRKRLNAYLDKTLARTT